MQLLNLINSSKSDISYQKMQFPDGQPHIKIDVDSLKADKVKIITRIANPSDLFFLQLAKAVLDDNGIAHCELFITYLMAARMDRVMTDGEPLALRVVADCINALKFNKIEIFDPHSDVATALVRQAKAIENSAFAKKAIQAFYKSENLDLSRFNLVSPDAGAMKKIYHVAQMLGGAQVVECMKKRDIATGKLSGFKVFSDNLEGKDCFIIDDICDGGGTFAGVGEQLKAHNAGKVILVVSHGIFSKGFDIPNIDFMFSTDSYKDLPSIENKLKVINL